MAAAQAVSKAGGDAARSPGRHPELLPPVRFGVVEAINGNIKALLRRGRGYTNLRYLLLKAQKLAALKTEFLVLRKAA